MLVKATPADIPVIQKIARATWPVAYGHILSKDQVAYMLEQFYSTASLTRQMDEGHAFFILSMADESLGFIDLQRISPDKMKLHKLYLLPEKQGNGHGQFLLDSAKKIAREQKADFLLLNVNRHNRAKAFYEKNDFVVIKQEDIDIGSGYFMNDFVMACKLAPPAIV